jgi:hypothetical protein
MKTMRLLVAVVFAFAVPVAMAQTQDKAPEAKPGCCAAMDHSAHQGGAPAEKAAPDAAKGCCGGEKAGAPAMDCCKDGKCGMDCCKDGTCDMCGHDHAKSGDATPAEGCCAKKS